MFYVERLFHCVLATRSRWNVVSFRATSSDILNWKVFGRVLFVERKRIWSLAKALSAGRNLILSMLDFFHFKLDFSIFFCTSLIWCDRKFCRYAIKSFRLRVFWGFICYSVKSKWFFLSRWNFNEISADCKCTLIIHIARH